MKYVLRTIVLSFFALFIANGAHAQEKDRTYKNWTVYITKLQGKKTCYMASFPTNKKGNYRRRDEPYLLVTRMANNVYEVSASSGYPYKKGSDINVDVDGKKYTMFTQGELAWAHGAQQDIDMVRQMKAGNKFMVRGTSQLGTYSIDTYSLSGFTAAFNRMNSEC